jgi:hypothetical protein
MQSVIEKELAWRLLHSHTRRYGVRGLHLESDSALKLECARSVSSGLKAARSRPQQAERELPDKQGVNSSRHDGFPVLKSLPSFRYRRGREREA